MACLEIRKDSKWWYGRWTVDGKTYVKNLDVTMPEKHPDSVNKIGDRRFELSRAKAQAKLDELIRQSLERRHSTELLQTLHTIRTGHRIGSVELKNIFYEWSHIPRRRKPSATYIKWVERVIKRFTDFMTLNSPQPKEMADVTYEMATKFIAAEESRGIAVRTYNAELSLLHGVFKHLRRQAGMTENPFEGIIQKDTDSIHRKPFTPEELKAILDAAKDDAFCRPLITTGICTAMRRGDVCLLKWTDVDMKNRFITVKTGKTGARVQVPMFSMLCDELSTLPHTSEYCFPEAAAMYKANVDGVNYRLKKVFEAAGFMDNEASESTVRREAEDITPIAERKRIVLGKLSQLTDKDWTNKVRETMRKVYELYSAGQNVNEVANKLSISKGSVSHHLHRVESLVGFPVVRRPVSAKPAIVRDNMYGIREGGLHRVNQRGFHALRASWVTLALTAGVPIELVRRVTGHTTVETVLTHYFQPGREDFRRALQSAMPKLLTDGAPTKEEQVKAIIEKMTPKTCNADRKKLLQLLTPA